MPRWNLGWLLGITAITLVGLSFAYTAPKLAGDMRSKHDNVSLLIDVMDEVQRKYVKKLDDKKMREFVENMVNGGLQQLDPHSGFINEDENKRFTKLNRGSFGGIGVKIIKDPGSGQVVVESPMVGTPAYKAGIVAGDVITKVDGVSLEGKTLSEVSDMIQGEPGEKVVLTIIHPTATDPVDITVVRDRIRIDSVLGDLPTEDESKWDYWIDDKNKVAYVRIVAFTHTTVDELSKVVQKLQLQGMKGLVIDLRNNPGGLLQAAVGVSGAFLPNGKTIVTTRGRDKEEEVYRSRTPPGLPAPVTDVPIVILLNRFSASASEIVAAALKDHMRAVIVGERSYGKGSVQNVIPMENGRTALKLTTASYWRPSNKNIHRFPDSKEEDDWGVKPDTGMEVKQTLKDIENYYKYRRERDILRKPGQAKNGDPKNGSSDKDAKKDAEEFKDRVLEKALEVIRAEIQKKGAKSAAVQPQLRQPGIAPAAAAERTREFRQEIPAGTMARYPLIPEPPRKHGPVTA